MLPRQFARPLVRRAVQVAGLLLAVPCMTVGAQQIFKSVDADGHVVYSNQEDPSAPQTPVALTADGPELPPVIHFCWTNCFTLKLDSGSYRRTDGTVETWTVERFGTDGVVLHRHDTPAAWNGHRTDVIYKGQVADEQLTNVTINGRPVTDVAMAWGAALDSLPGSNTERDQRHWVPPQSPGMAPSVQEPVAIGSGGEVTTSLAPPPLQDDTQPENTVDGYLWTPGYWGWFGRRYYWVPGTWVRPPGFGLLWTPGYWSYVGGVYIFHPGYWGQHVGYYGGINYGCGYFGSGFTGGHWNGSTFAYNRSVGRVNTNAIHNTYSEAVVTPVNAARVSYNGGPGGVAASPTPQEQAASAESHLPPTSRQRQAAQAVAGVSTKSSTVRSSTTAAPVTTPSTSTSTPAKARDATSAAATPAPVSQARAPSQSKATTGSPAETVEPASAKGSAEPKATRGKHS